ncbi:MAG: hypothetical protein U5K69_07025 [Balneolaceae bacterium]|nr:hypothetical protein [Balneolaceae bacterium]
MYSNDMWAGHPENPEILGTISNALLEKREVIIDSVTADHQKDFTTWFTEESGQILSTETVASRSFYMCRIPSRTYRCL